MHLPPLLAASVILLLADAACAAPVTALAFSSDGSVLAAASGRNVTLRFAATGRESGSISCEGERAQALAFQPGGPLLAIGTGTPGEKGGVRLFDWRLQQWLGAIATNLDVVTGVDFSPDGKLIATASADKSAAVYRIESGGAKLTPLLSLAGHSAAVQAIAFSPDGQTIVTASVDRSLKVWSVTDGRLLRSFAQHTDAVLALAFRPVTRDRAEAPPYCASGGDDRTVRVWQPAIGRMVRIVRGHEGPVLAVAFSPDGSSLYSAGHEGLIRRFDADSDEQLGEWRASDDWIYAIAISPRGRMLATGDWSGRVRRWSVEGNRPVALDDEGRTP